MLKLPVQEGDRAARPLVIPCFQPPTHRDQCVLDGREDGPLKNSPFLGIYGLILPCLLEIGTPDEISTN